MVTLTDLRTRDARSGAVGQVLALLTAAFLALAVLVGLSSVLGPWT